MLATTLFLISLQQIQIQEYIHISVTGTNFEGIPRFHRKYTDDFPVEHKKAIYIWHPTLNSSVMETSHAIRIMYIDSITEGPCNI